MDQAKQWANMQMTRKAGTQKSVAATVVEFNLPRDTFAGL